MIQKKCTDSNKQTARLFKLRRLMCVINNSVKGYPP